MSGKVALRLRSYNPDVLTCIANLSNDEVFTPPEFANRMLDTLEQAWAETNDGASIWSDPTVTFLDPATKSGVFLREITRRLTDGLAERIPDLEERVDHILTKQVFGIGITRLTALLSRRSVYCSKAANGPHSIAKSFDTADGNIWFERTEHTWGGGRVNHALLDPEGKPVIEGRRCRFCGAGDTVFERGDELETHAYAFIHTDDIRARLTELFGADMHFDVIIGNPPYQMTGAAGGSSDASIYHRFVEQAQRLDPRFLSMVIPSRWMAGGRGLGDFRETMLRRGHLRALVDFPNAKEAFPGVEIKGGVCYFLWDSAYAGRCSVRTIRNSEVVEATRDLAEFDVFVRDARAASILHKVQQHGEPSITEILSRDTPFGIPTNYSDYRLTPQDGDVAMHLISRSRRLVGYVDRATIAKNSADINTWKVLAPEGYGAGETVPHQILGQPVIAPPPSACTQSYLYFAVESRDAAVSVASYYSTRFFRFLVSLRKITQHALHSTYRWVPMQSWDRVWTDTALYEKYGITVEEQAYIDSQVRKMSFDAN